jgi:hypothetical protein
VYLNSVKGTVSRDEYSKSRREYDLTLLATMKTLLKCVPKATTEFSWLLILQITCPSVRFSISWTLMIFIPEGLYEYRRLRDWKKLKSFSLFGENFEFARAEHVKY